MAQKTFPRIRGTSQEIQSQARRLRREMTPAEEALWKHLRGRQLQGLKFRRQHPVGRFIADFYCPERRPVVELDGEIHRNQQEYDEVRTETFQDYGYRVLRFPNQMVLQHMEKVLEAIVAAVAPLPSPSIGRGKGPGDG